MGPQFEDREHKRGQYLNVTGECFRAQTICVSFRRESPSSPFTVERVDPKHE